MDQVFKNSAADVSKKIMQYGVHHNMINKVIARFYQTIDPHFRMPHPPCFLDRGVFLSELRHVDFNSLGDAVDQIETSPGESPNTGPTPSS